MTDWVNRNLARLGVRLTARTSAMIAGFVFLAALVGVPWLIDEVSFSGARDSAGAPTRPLPAALITGQRLVTWRGQDGALYRAAVDAKRHDAFLAAQFQMLEAGRRDLVPAAERRLRAELSPVFAAMEDRVPDYADWVFNWWTSYILLVRGLKSVWDSVAQKQPIAVEDVVEKILVTEIKEKYRAVLLQPETTVPDLAAAANRAFAATRADLQRLCAGFDRAFGEFIGANSAAAETATANGAWRPVNGSPRTAPMLPASVCADSGEIRLAPAVYNDLMSIDGRIDDVIVRITRPFATVVVSAGLSASGVVTVIAGIGAPLPVIAGPALFAVLVKYTFTFVDLTLSRLDENLNRPGFETAVHELIRDGRAEFEKRAIAAQMAALDRQRQDIRQTLLARP
ncbi:MAG: hypothetical protein HY057_10750 [Rhodospirillales bacterium]|nr:hypothetical protein [Rhodospirillales bacterium]